MPRGYVRTGKNADPEFNLQRARAASAVRTANAARAALDAAIRKVVDAAPELTDEQRETLRAIVTTR